LTRLRYEGAIPAESLAVLLALADRRHLGIWQDFGRIF